MTGTIHRPPTGRVAHRVQYALNAAEAIGAVDHGCEIYGLARGAFMRKENDGEACDSCMRRFNDAE
jgi:hypothetical protein